MSLSLDKIFGIHAKALEFRAQRAEVLAYNIVNADTPGFKAQDIDFDSALDKESSKNLALSQTNSAHQMLSDKKLAFETFSRPTKYTSLNGNTVDTQVEHSEYAKNALRYQASLTFMNGSIRSIMTAIKGE